MNNTTVTCWKAEGVYMVGDHIYAFNANKERWEEAWIVSATYNEWGYIMNCVVEDTNMERFSPVTIAHFEKRGDN